jgi:hypothetical protein
MLPLNNTASCATFQFCGGPDGGPVGGAEGGPDGGAVGGPVGELIGAS